MNTQTEVNKSQAEAFYGRSPDQDIELWKHHASFGGEDKNRMVTIASFLLGFSAAIVGYIVERLVAPNAFKLGQPLKALAAAALGILASGFAGVGRGTG